VLIQRHLGAGVGAGVLQPSISLWLCRSHPLFYFPAFYVLKGTVEGRPLASSIDKYKEDLWENCKALWTVWVPAQVSTA
jgi:hypothetical protein